MARRGFCKCGNFLEAQRGPGGYKTRCAQCQAIVRLRRPKKRRSHSAKPELRTCECG